MVYQIITLSKSAAQKSISEADSSAHQVPLMSTKNRNLRLSWLETSPSQHVKVLHHERFPHGDKHLLNLISAAGLLLSSAQPGNTPERESV